MTGSEEEEERKKEEKKWIDLNKIFFGYENRKQRKRKRACVVSDACALSLLCAAILVW